MGSGSTGKAAIRSRSLIFQVILSTPGKYLRMVTEFAQIADHEVALTDSTKTASQTIIPTEEALRSTDSILLYLHAASSRLKAVF